VLGLYLGSGLFSEYRISFQSPEIFWVIPVLFSGLELECKPTFEITRFVRSLPNY
jgi:hypothetical protein